jgi:hypothetical protein
MSQRNGMGLVPSPVFVYEWITSTRRWQVYALRSLFVLGLLVATMLIGLSREAVESGGPARLRALAEVGERLFVAVVGTQLTLVLLAAPAATAGAICLDRSRGTLTHLLVTDLSDREIVLGKLAARLVPVLVMIAATLPVMALLTLLGGVDPDALLFERDCGDVIGRGTRSRQPGRAHDHADGNSGNRDRQVARHLPAGPATGNTSPARGARHCEARDWVADGDRHFCVHPIGGRVGCEPRSGDGDMVPAARPRRRADGQPVSVGNGRLVLRGRRGHTHAGRWQIGDGQSVLLAWSGD